MIVAFHSQPSLVVLRRQLHHQARQFQSAHMARKLGTLHARIEVEHLRGRKIPLAAAPRRIHRNKVTPPFQRRQPHLQFSVVAPFLRFR